MQAPVLPLRILLIEDDEDDFRLVRDLLSHVSVQRYTLEWMAEYRSGLEALVRGSFDVCLLDYRLGARNGLELFKQASVRRCTVPVIILTGHNDRRVAVETMHEGVADYLTKAELSASLLESSLRHAIGRTLVDAPDGAQGEEEIFVRSALNGVSDRRLAEEALRENEERLRLVIEHAPVGLAILDREMRYLNVSRKWCEDYKLPYGDLTGRSHYEVFPEGEEWKGVYSRALAGEALRVEEDRFVRADGCAQWLEWEVRPWRNAAGDVGGIVLLTKDITETRSARELLRIERDLALRLGATDDLSEALQHLLGACLEFEGMDSGAIYLVERETGALKLICCRGIRDGLAKRVSFFESESPQAHFVMGGEPLYRSKPITISGLDEILAREGLTAVGSIPVKYNGAVVAHLNVGSHSLPEIPKAIRLALEHIASEIGGVIARVRLGETVSAQGETLKEANIALNVLLKQREKDRDELAESLLRNVRSLILPYLEKLKKSRLKSEQRQLLEIVESHLREISSPFVKNIAAPLLGLTPAEIRVADLVRQGKSSREIASLLSISEYAVIFHRHGIRRKLDLSGRKVNLQTYLRSLQQP